MLGRGRAAGRRGESQEQTGAAMKAPLVAQPAQGLCECLQDQQRHGVVAVRSEPELALI